MTVLYWFLKRIFPLSLRAFFGQFTTKSYDLVPVNDPIIFVSNHPSALLDPLVCGIAIHTPIHFLGRADLFKNPIVGSLLRKSHMWPIYRDVDGKSSLEKNNIVFDQCYRSLKNGGPILLYGEGVTDERFIRRVKRIKKGAARIAFGAEEAYDFKMGLKIVPVGLNYSNPEKINTDLLVHFGTPIDVKDYEAIYKKSPSKGMLSLTRKVEEGVLEVSIHIENIEETKAFEQILMLYENSLHYHKSDGAVDLDERWIKTKELSQKINDSDKEAKDRIFQLVSNFWNKLSVNGEELYIVKELNGKRTKRIFDLVELILGLPFALIGVILNLPVFYLLHILPGIFTRRICFHSGLRIALGTVLIPLFLSIEYLIFNLFYHIPYLYPALIIGGISMGIYAIKFRAVLGRTIMKSRAIKKLKKVDSFELKTSYDQILNELENLN